MELNGIASQLWGVVPVGAYLAAGTPKYSPVRIRDRRCFQLFFDED